MEARLKGDIDDKSTNVFEMVLLPWRFPERVVRVWADCLSTSLQPWLAVNPQEAEPRFPLFRADQFGKLWLAFTHSGLECAEKVRANLNVADTVIAGLLDEQIAAREAIQRVPATILTAGLKLLDIGVANTRACTEWGEEVLGRWEQATQKVGSGNGSSKERVDH